MPADEMKKTIENDPIQKSISGFGWWQLMVFVTICLLKFPVAWHQMSIIFLAPPIDYHCVEPEGFNGTLGRCDTKCNGHVFDRSVFQETITTQWNLICAQDQLANASQTIFMLGILIGNVVFGSLADKFGRRGPLVFAVLIQLVSGVATAFAPWFWLFCLLRFLTALATGGTMLTSFVLIMEIIGVKWRELLSVIYQIPFNLGHLTLPIFAYFIRDWRHLQLALSIPSILLVSYYWLVPESPRWLITVGRVEEASRILKKAAEMNKMPTDTINKNLEAAIKLKGADSPISRGNILDLVKTPNMRTKTLCMCFNWFVCGISFFGVAQYIGHMSGDIFLNVAISAAITLPGTVIGIYCMKSWGRKYTLIASNTVCGISMLAIAFVPENQALAVVVLASSSMIGMSISFPTCYLYAGEIFPTVVRNIGMGTSSMIARIGSMVAPFVVGAISFAHWLPPLIFGTVPIIGAFLTFLLPETKGAPLPETIEDGENFGKKFPTATKEDIESGK
ncbi:organic cation transporter protein isoform X2 [Phlebotomus argentipes]|uniref:organic cation transporter protein isoform X2 n=1 Tax=Phlebotomus argentipes TaxID=94469 RepID=UPI002892B9C2|nr:organic cation transporter protein isoform X2 [Phlebotomus argentipes]